MGKRTALRILILLTVVLSACIKYGSVPLAEAKAKEYLVLVEEKDGTWSRYEGYTEVKKDGIVMVKAAALAKAAGGTYIENSTSDFSIAYGKKENIYTRGSRKYQFNDGNKAVYKKAKYQPYSSKEANLIDYTTLRTLFHVAYYQGKKAASYQEDGYEGVLCFSGYHNIRQLPENVAGSEGGTAEGTAEGYVQVNDYMQVKVNLADEASTTLTDISAIKKQTPGSVDDLNFSLWYYWDTPEGKKDLYTSEFNVGSGEVELHAYLYMLKPAALHSFGVGMNVEFGELIKDKKNGNAELASYQPAIGSIIEYHVKLNIDQMKHTFDAGRQKLNLYADGGTNSLGMFYFNTSSTTGRSFKLSRGFSGQETTLNYKYSGGKPYAVEYYFTLETGEYGGSYSLGFPIEGSTDTQTFTTKPLSVYQITYTYGIKYSASTNHKYTLEFALVGPKSVTIKSVDTHPGKLTKGSLKVIKIK
jgi:hypothetical protein